MTFADLRKEYSLAGLSEKDLARDPFRQFEKWFQEVEAAKIPEPNAAIVATATKDGRSSARGSTAADSSFTRTTIAARAGSWRPTRGRPSSSPGSASSARSSPKA